MAALTWNETYSVNINHMDEQHKRLVKMINELGDAVAQNRGEEVLDRIFTDLMVYVSTHFMSEESLMKAHDYPTFDEHKAKHEAIAAQVAEMRRNARANPTLGTAKLLKFLSDWLVKHIMGTDKKYGEFLNAKGLS